MSSSHYNLWWELKVHGTEIDIAENELNAIHNVSSDRTMCIRIENNEHVCFDLMWAQTVECIRLFSPFIVWLKLASIIIDKDSSIDRYTIHATMLTIKNLSKGWEGKRMPHKIV